MIIDDNLLNDMLEKAKSNVRLRVNLDLRNSSEDTSTDSGWTMAYADPSETFSYPVDL